MTEVPPTARYSIKRGRLVEALEVIAWGFENRSQLPPERGPHCNEEAESRQRNAEADLRKAVRNSPLGAKGRRGTQQRATEEPVQDVGESVVVEEGDEEVVDEASPEAPSG